MRASFFKIVFCFFLVSCSQIDFVLDTKKDQNVIRNDTSIYVSGWDNPALKEELFLKLGETTNQRFLLNAEVSEKQTKRSVGENQVAKKIDYMITVDYVLVDSAGLCPNIKKSFSSSFSFTPKSSGYNFASDVLLQSLFEEAAVENVTKFISFADNKIIADNCLDEN